MVKRTLLFLCVCLIGGGFALTLSKNGDYSYVPVSFSHFSKKPLIEVTIENKQYQFLIDTGSCLAVCSQSRVLAELKNKRLQGKSDVMGIKGLRTQLSDFWVPSLSVGTLFVNDVVISEEVGKSGEGIVWDPLGQHEGRILQHVDGAIGWPVLKQYYCLFDFGHKALFLSKNSGVLKPERAMRFNRWIAVPFLSGKFGMTITVDTDVGIKRLVLDTGATHSVLRGDFQIQNSEWVSFKSEKLVMNGHDLHEWEFFTYPIPEEARDIDGVLGVDFFLKHVVYIDPRKQIAYISI